MRRRRKERQLAASFSYIDAFLCLVQPIPWSSWNGPGNPWTCPQNLSPRRLVEGDLSQGSWRAPGTLGGSGTRTFAVARLTFRRRVDWRGEAVCECGRFASIRRVELPQDVGDVHAGGLDADHECCSDLAVRVAAGDEHHSSAPSPPCEGGAPSCLICLVKPSGQWPAGCGDRSGDRSEPWHRRSTAWKRAHFQALLQALFRTRTGEPLLTILQLLCLSETRARAELVPR